MGTACTSSWAIAACENRHANAAHDVAIRYFMESSQSGLGAIAGYQPVPLSSSNQVIEPGLDAALFVRNLGERKTHLHAAQCSGQHEIVEIAQMANAKNFSVHLSQAVAERHVELLEDQFAQFVGVVPRRQQHRGH